MFLEAILLMKTISPSIQNVFDNNWEGMFGTIKKIPFAVPKKGKKAVFHVN